MRTAGNSASSGPTPGGGSSSLRSAADAVEPTGDRSVLLAEPTAPPAGLAAQREAADDLSVDVVARAPGQVAGDGARPAPAARRWAVVAGALALVTVAGAGLTAWVATAGPGAHAPADPPGTARAAAVAAASQEVVNFTTYDYRTIGRDFDRVAALSTGRFARDFRTGSADLEKLIVAGKASSKGEVVAAGAQTFSPGHAQVLLAVDDTVKNAKVPAGAVRRYRFAVTVDLVGGRWLVSDLHPVT